MSNHSNAARDRLGVIATLRERHTGEVVVRHANTTREVAAWCDAADGDWRVVTLSTWRTIYADIATSRVHPNPDKGTYTAFPEPEMLGVIGRLDLLDGSFAANEGDRKNRRRREHA